jgi:hypothetical protein
MILMDFFFFAILYNAENISGPLRFHFEQVLVCYITEERPLGRPSETVPLV